MFDTVRKIIDDKIDFELTEKISVQIKDLLDILDSFTDYDNKEFNNSVDEVCNIFQEHKREIK